MGKKLIGIAVIAIMLFGIFGLAGCEGFNLDEYKANAEAAIQTHASTKIAEYDYTNAGLQAIAKAVADGKDAVDVADSKGKVDTAVNAAKAEINAVWKKSENSIAFELVVFKGAYNGSSSERPTSTIVRSQEELIALFSGYGIMWEDDIAIWEQYDNEYFEEKVLVFHFFGTSGDDAPKHTVEDAQVNGENLKLFIAQHGFTEGDAYFDITILVEVSKSDMVGVTKIEAEIRNVKGGLQVSDMVTQFNLADPKEYWNGTVHDDFEIDRVVIVFKKTSVFPQLELKHFNLENGERLEYTSLKPDDSFSTDATYMAGYRQMAVIYLNEQGKEKVLEAIKHLEKLDFIMYAGPEMIFVGGDD